MPKLARTSAPVNLDAALAPLAAVLAPLLAPLVAAELARRGAAEEYTSDALPVGVSRRTFRTRCASGLVAGARREGHVWTCARVAWHASFPRRGGPGARAAEDAPAQHEDLDAMLAAGGLRGTR